MGIEPAAFVLLIQCSANWATRSSRFLILFYCLYTGKDFKSSDVLQNDKMMKVVDKYFCF